MTSAVEVADGIYRIDAGPLTGKSGDSLSYSLVHLMVSDGETAIIDIGPAVMTPSVIDALRSLGFEPARLSYVILTHIHLDHAGGAGTLAKQFPEVKVAVHRRGASHLIDTQRLIEGTRQAYGPFETDYGPIEPVSERQVRPVDDGDIIRVGKRELRIIHTPGHASHHMSIYDVQRGGLFSGDSLGFLAPGKNPIVIVSGFDLALALESIDRMQSLHPRRVYTAHGTAEREPQEFIESVRTTTKEYGDVILEAVKARASEEEVGRRLNEYREAHNPADPGAGQRRFDDIVPWYVAYFKRKGMV